MAGLVPAIRASTGAARDGRDKPCHDDARERCDGFMLLTMAHWPRRPTSTRDAARRTHGDPGLAQPYRHRGSAARHPRGVRRLRPLRAAGQRTPALFDRMAGLADIGHRYSFFAPGPKPRDHILDSERFYRRGGFPSTGDRMARSRDMRRWRWRCQAVAALDIAGDRAAITHLIVASCTGFTAPGLDFHIMGEAGSRRRSSARSSDSWAASPR